MDASKERIRYDANVCGGDFGHVRERFDTWKRESLVYRPERRMFDGKDEVRALNRTVYDGPQRAAALVGQCAPSDPHALAVQLTGRTHDVAGDGGLRRLSEAADVRGATAGMLLARSPRHRNAHAAAQERHEDAIRAAPPRADDSRRRPGPAAARARRSGRPAGA